jgi:Zn-dependent peptidase ImmA (M78 family)
MFGERIKRARIKSALSLEALAQKANNIVTKQAISQYEKNQKNPSSTVLIALANALDVSVEYFFRTIEVQIGEVDFRKHSAFGKKKQEVIKEKVREYLERYIQIEEILEIQSPFVNPIKDDNLITMDDIENIVMRLRKEWNLGFDPIYNIVEMLELKNIKVLLLNDDKKFNGLSGHANNDSSHQFIVLNTNRELSDDRKRFTALHELGHQLLPHHELDEEKASDRFAGAFLFPKESVLKEFGERRTKISFEELKHIKHKYGISIAGIIFRLHQLRIINDAMFKRFWIQNRTAKFDDKVILKRDEKVTRFENLLAHAYSEKLISLSKLAELSGESVDDALAKYGEMI